MPDKKKEIICTPTAEEKTVKTVLLDAATILETEGWKRRDWGAFCGPKCVDGALIAACASDEWRRDRPEESTYLLQNSENFGLLEKARSVFADTVAPGRTGTAMNVIARFNDSQKDKRKVIRLLRKVAKKV